MDFTSFISTSTVVVCAVLGYTIKNAFDFIPNKYIPLIMGILGVLINVFSAISVGETIDFNAFSTGLISGAASTGCYEMVRNFINKGDKNNG